MEHVRTVWEQYDNLRQKIGKDPVCQASGGLASVGRDDEHRRLAFILSVGGINRNNWDVVQTGWHLSNYRANPVVFWGHDDTGLPIATSQKEWLASAPDLGIHLRGMADFVTADMNEFADKVYQMYLAGHLRAVSVRWRGLKVEEIDAEEFKSQNLPVPSWFRPGLRFLESELYEYSCVGIPGEPRALMLACQKGIITQGDMDKFSVNSPPMLRCGDEPVFVLTNAAPRDVDVPVLVDLGQAMAASVEQSKVIPFASYPVADKQTPWDGSGARNRLAKWASSDESGDKDKVDWKKYQRGFAYVDADNAENFGSYKLPHHDVIDGALKVVPRGVSAAAQRIQQGKLDVPIGDIAGIKAHIEKEYKHAWVEEAPWKRESGAAYEEMYQLLNQKPEMAPWIRDTVVKLAIETYRECRILEPWEQPDLPSGPDGMWAAVSEVLGGMLSVVVDEESQEDGAAARISSACSKIADIINPTIEKYEREAQLLHTVAARVGVTLDTDNEESILSFKVAIDALFLPDGKSKAEENSTPTPVEDAQAAKPSIAIEMDEDLKQFLDYLNKKKEEEEEQRETTAILSLMERIRQEGNSRAGSA